jgi:hypothetical protein
LVVGDAALAFGLGIKAAVNPQPECGSVAPRTLQSTADHTGVVSAWEGAEEPEPKYGVEPKYGNV